MKKRVIREFNATVRVLYMLKSVFIKITQNLHDPALPHISGKQVPKYGPELCKFYGRLFSWFCVNLVKNGLYTSQKYHNVTTSYLCIACANWVKMHLNSVLKINTQVVATKSLVIASFVDFAMHVFVVFYEMKVRLLI